MTKLASANALAYQAQGRHLDLFLNIRLGWNPSFLLYKIKYVSNIFIIQAGVTILASGNTLVYQAQG